MDFEGINPDSKAERAEATTPVPQAKVSSSTPLSYVLMYNLSLFNSTKFILVPTSLKREL